MDIKNFNEYVIYPAVNGLIVRNKVEEFGAVLNSDTYVFNDFEEFSSWLKDRLLEPE